MNKNQDKPGLNVLRWSLLTLGVGKLTLILTRDPLYYILTTVPIAFFSVIFLRRVELKSKISNEILATALSYLFLSTLYDFVVLLQFSVSHIILHAVAAIAFYCASFITMLLIKVKDVAP
jgi:hypothetical protein